MSERIKTYFEEYNGTTVMEDPVFSVHYKGCDIECYSTITGDYNWVFINGVLFGASNYGDITIDTLNGAFEFADSLVPTN